jgi:hypothetical protein
MDVVIQVSPKDIARAWGLLVRHSAGTALPNRTFVVSREAARALRRERVKFAVISRNGAATRADGVPVGERI